MLKNLRPSHIASSGYASLRCCWTLGCPDEMHPTSPRREDLKHEAPYAEVWPLLFPSQPVPDVVGVACCAPFGLTRATILARPRAYYVDLREWLLATPLPDDVSGRILEYSWHIIFGKPPVHCPPARECYCATFGYCGLECDEGVCKGRYTLPPFSTLPEGWPVRGWHGAEGPAAGMVDGNGGWE
jgi:hypothetical protein